MSAAVVWAFLILGPCPQHVDGFPSQADCEMYRTDIVRMAAGHVATTDCIAHPVRL